MSIELMMEVLSYSLVVLGALVMLVAMIGVVRFPDLYCRAHALGKGLTLGVSLMLLSLWIDLGPDVAGLKIVAAIFFQFLTIPVASHLLALAAMRRGLPQHSQKPLDDHRSKSV
jgi:multicomponent Na+:H+ antiporter subunit G